MVGQNLSCLKSTTTLQTFVTPWEKCKATTAWDDHSCTRRDRVDKIQLSNWWALGIVDDKNTQRHHRR